MAEPRGASTSPEPYPLYAFCAEQLPDDWRTLSSGNLAHLVLTAATDPAAPPWPEQDARTERCRHTGLAVATCKADDICDCFDHPPEVDHG